MFNHPVLKSCYRVEVIAPDTLLLLHEAEPRILHGRLYPLILPLLDGTRSVDDLIRDLGAEVQTAELFYVLGLLAKAGHIVEHDPAAETAVPVPAFWHSLGVDLRVLCDRLRERPVALRSIDGAAVEPLREALASLRVRVVHHDGGSARLTVIVASDYLAEGIEAHNQRAIETRAPWMLVRLVGTSAWMGPIFEPGKPPAGTACWMCLAQRLEGNRPLETALKQRLRSKAVAAVARAGPPVGVRAAANLAAIEIARWIAGAGGRLDGTLVTLDLLRLELQDHVVVKRPQCRACGGPSERARAHNTADAFVLQSCRKLLAAGGGHRAVSPQQTIVRFGHHISPITGAVRVLTRLPVEEHAAIHSFDAGPNLAHWGDAFSSRHAGFRSHSGGKGQSEIQARASALCEALERYSGVFQGDEPRRTARGRDLGDAALDPSSCLGFSQAQYERRRAWNAPDRPAHELIPEPYDPAVAIEWSPAWSLVRDGVRFVPTSYCYYGYPCPPEQRFCWADSNGCAAGNTREEAVLHGLLELVERDAVGLWWYNRLRRPRVDLTSFGDPYFDQVTEDYQRQGREIWMLDLTSDLGFPTFAALSRRTDQAREEILLGFGAHLDAPIAATRAVTEMNQFLAVISARPFSRASRSGMADMVSAWLDHVTLANQPHLGGDRAAPKRVAADHAPQSSDDLAEDVRRCTAVIAARGMDVLVLDQTRPDIGLPVVRVMAPGLRHFWPRFGPGRLYDVPVQMGWLHARLAEEDLNPISVFL